MRKRHKHHDCNGNELVWRRAPPDRPGEWWAKFGKRGRPTSLLIESVNGRLGWYDGGDFIIADRDDAVWWAPNRPDDTITLTGGPHDGLIVPLHSIPPSRRHAPTLRVNRFAGDLMDDAGNIVAASATAVPRTDEYVLCGPRRYRFARTLQEGEE